MTDFLRIEPLIIEYGSHQWINPEISEVAQNYIGESTVNKNCYGPGRVQRFWLEHENGEKFHMVAATDDVIDETFWKYDEEKDEMTKASEEQQEEVKHDMIEMIRLMLGEDFWAPAGEQFVFSEFGSELNKKFPMFEGTVKFRFSPDICVHPMDEEAGRWGWST